ncbi:unnamed protein product [Coffea canephora]|uniref:Uncharacterized protein n=1 Tax=Coffea canephora TaxID=49390 RepID=A0A068V606_COFCA|nr:unnamed protein product [Coffea canephora]
MSSEVSPEKWIALSNQHHGIFVLLGEKNKIVLFRKIATKRGCRWFSGSHTCPR